jgi:hypothetical protein
MALFSKAFLPSSPQAWKHCGVLVNVSLSLSHVAPAESAGEPAAHNGRVIKLPVMRTDRVFTSANEVIVERSNITRPIIPPGSEGGSAFGVHDAVLGALASEPMCRLEANGRFRELLEADASDFGMCSKKSRRALPTVIQWITGCFIGYSNVTEARPISIESHEEAEDRAVHFVASLMTGEYEDIKDSPNMRVLRNVYNLERGVGTFDVIARDITQRFWQSCIDKVSNPGKSCCRITAIGTPGVGKTFATSILVRMLLDKGHKVVYLIKSSNDTSWYYEFFRDSGGKYTANVYPESIRDNIVSLTLPSTFYIVDSGRTSSVDCSPSDTVQARVILVASPDWRHREGHSCPADSLRVSGEVMCYPPWSLAELVAARQVINPLCDASDVVERYPIFGGVPGNIFGRHDMFVLQNQELALSKMSPYQLERILKSELIPLECFNPENPVSALMTYDLRRDANGERSRDFDDIVVAPASQIIAESVHHEYWGPLSRATVPKGITQKFVVALLTRSPEWSAEISALRAFVDEDKLIMGPINLPYCTSAEEVPDPIRAVTDPNSLALNLYFSSNSSNELIDCIYKDEADHVHAIHIAFDKPPTKSMISQAKKKLLPLASYSEVTLYIFVPSALFDKFYVSPYCPDVDPGVPSDVVIVSVSKPKLHRMSILQNPKYEMNW